MTMNTDSTDFNVISDLRAPYPYFGGKYSISQDVWNRLGNAPVYVEPFFGSGAMLLARPDDHAWWNRQELVNDKDGFICNIWRAISNDLDSVAEFSDWPINENDLHARHLWLVNQRMTLTERLIADPTWFDPKVAGYWLWGICQWIGGGWCSGDGPWNIKDGQLTNSRPSGNRSLGVQRRRPSAGSMGIHKKRPSVGGRGVNSDSNGINRQRPMIGLTGINTAPDMEGCDNICEVWHQNIYNTMQRLSNRLRKVRVCCGDWSRVMGPAATTTFGLTAAFLDPPYSAQAGRDNHLYATEDLAISHEVRKWCIENGNNPLFRIALCGYDGEYEMPGDWEVFHWKAPSAGYGAKGDDARGKLNASREVIWFSPHCNKVSEWIQPSLFTEG